MWNEQKHLVALRKRIEPLLQQEGVHYHGMQSEAVLAKAYSSAGFYAYPTDKAETSGIALMKAQSCGCIPITSGQRISALPETSGQFDLGPIGREEGKYIMYEVEWQQDFVRALIAAAKRPTEELGAFRQRMRVSARSRFSWAAVAKQWTDLFKNQTKAAAAAAAQPKRAPPTPPTPPPPSPKPLPSSQPAAAARSSSSSSKAAKARASTVFLEVGLEELPPAPPTAPQPDAAAARDEMAALEAELTAQAADRAALEERAGALEARLRACRGHL